jgi:hypothetical protein
LAWLFIAPLQSMLGQHVKPCMFDTAAHRDTAAVTLYLRVHADGDTGTDPIANASLATTLRSRWHPPETIGRMFYPYTVGNPAQWANWHRTAPQLELAPPSGAFSFTVSVDRHLRQILVQSTSGDSATDASLVGALEDAERDGDTAPFAYAVGALGSTLIAELYQDGASGGAPLVQVHVLRITVDSPVVFKSAPLRSTPAIRKQGKSGFATMRYVVDEAGRVEPSSLHAIEATGGIFADAARSALLGAKFKPARTGGCPVKMLVEQRIMFFEGQ